MGLSLGDDLDLTCPGRWMSRGFCPTSTYDVGMRVETVALGVGIVAVGIAALYVARNVFPRLGLPREYRDLIRLTTAVVAAGLIVFGLLVVVLGLLGW